MRPTDCPDCTTLTADHHTTGLRAAAIRYCPRHKSESADNIAAARAANPEIDAIHRMLGR